MAAPVEAKVKAATIGVGRATRWQSWLHRCTYAITYQLNV